jgi:hypothetical protein
MSMFFPDFVFSGVGRSLAGMSRATIQIILATICELMLLGINSE